MKTRILPFLLLLTCFGRGNPLLAVYTELHTTWDSLPLLYLPPLESRTYTGIALNISNVPPGAYGQLDSYGKCADLCKWDCDVSQAGKMRLEIDNAYGYGSRYGPCDSPIRLRFGVMRAGKQIAHCTLEFRILGSRILPKIRIGEVLVKLRPMNEGHTDREVYICPQIELILPEGGDPLGLRPIWAAEIEGTGFRSITVQGWNDCAGLTKRRELRGPCKPDAIPLSQLRASQGVVKITFHERVEAFVGEGEVKLAFETEELSFWYDLVHDKRVAR